MKIFYKKDFQRVLGEKKLLQKEYDNLLKRFNELSDKYDNNDYKFLEDYCKAKDKIEKLTKKNEEYKIANTDLENKVTELEDKVKQLNCSKGGYIKTINKLTNENQKLQDQLEESMTDKYLVRKVPEGKKPKVQTMKVKSSSVPSKIIKKIKED